MVQAEDRDVRHSLLAHTSSQACYRSLYSLHLLSSGHVPSSIAGDSPRHSTLEYPPHLSRNRMSSHNISTNMCLLNSSYLLQALRGNPPHGSTQASQNGGSSWDTSWIAQAHWNMGCGSSLRRSPGDGIASGSATATLGTEEQGGVGEHRLVPKAS